MEDRVQLLIDVLLDMTAREDERDDAAMDLGHYKDFRALEALAKIASDPHEENIIVDSCAESFAEICVGLNYFNEGFFRKMIPFAQSIVFEFIIAQKPELIKQPLRDELAKKFKMEDQVGLINILFDRTTQKSERITAAINLKKYYTGLALTLFRAIASDPSEDKEVANDCAEFIAEICIELNYFREDLFREMSPVARKIVFDLIKAQKPELIHNPLRDARIKKFESRRGGGINCPEFEQK